MTFYMFKCDCSMTLSFSASVKLSQLGHSGGGGFPRGLNQPE